MNSTKILNKSNKMFAYQKNNLLYFRLVSKKFYKKSKKILKKFCQGVEENLIYNTFCGGPTLFFTKNKFGFYIKALSPNFKPVF